MWRNRFFYGILAGTVAGIVLAGWLYPRRTQSREVMSQVRARRLTNPARRVIGMVRRGAGDQAYK